jgi:hypothetical protein
MVDLITRRFQAEKIARVYVAICTRLHFFTFNQFYLMQKASFGFFAFILALALTSCEKSKEKSFEEKLIGRWHSVSVKAAGADVTGNNEFNINLEASKEFDLDVIVSSPFAPTHTSSFTGTWAQDDNKLDVTLTYDETEDQKTWDVKDISDNVMVAELIQNAVRYEIKFEK